MARVFRRLLLAIPTLGFVAILLVLIFGGINYRNERVLIDQCSRNSQTMPDGATILGGVGSPYIVGYERWIGPRFLERPMRQMGIPWFDRIVTVVIIRDHEVKLRDLEPLRKLAHLGEIMVTRDTYPENDYNYIRREFPAVKLTI